MSLPLSGQAAAKLEGRLICPSPHGAVWDAIACIEKASDSIICIAQQTVLHLGADIHIDCL